MPGSHDLVVKPGRVAYPAVFAAVELLEDLFKLCTAVLAPAGIGPAVPLEEV